MAMPAPATSSLPTPPSTPTQTTPSGSTTPPPSGSNTPPSGSANQGQGQGTPPPKRRKFTRQQTLEDAKLNDEEFSYYFPTLVRTPSMAFCTFGELSTIDAQNGNREAQKPNPMNPPDKFAANISKVREKKFVDGDYDNKYDLLHKLRFDKFPLSDSAKVFQLAGQFFQKLKEVLPVNSYEFLSMGNIYATEQGIELIHYPGNTNIKLKMFSVENATKPSNSSTSFSMVHDVSGNPVMIPGSYFSDLTDVEKFHMSFFNLFIWKTRACPWDRSLEVLWKYYLIHRWFDCEFVASKYKRTVSQGKFLSEFTDWCLFENASRFKNCLPHMNLSDLDSKLTTFCQSSGMCMFVGNTYAADLTKAENVVESLAGSAAAPVAGPSGTNKKQTPAPAPAFKAGPIGKYMRVRSICVNYNTGDCRNKFSAHTNKCFDAQTRQRYLHVCNVRMINPTVLDGGPCGQKHPRTEHPS